MVTSSLSERRGAGPGRSKICWIIGDPFITSSTIVKMVVRTVAFSSICSALLVCVVYTLKRTTVLFPCQQLAQSVYIIFISRRTFFCNLRRERMTTTSDESWSNNQPLDDNDITIK